MAWDSWYDLAIRDLSDPAKEMLAEAEQAALPEAEEEEETPVFAPVSPS